MYDAEEDFNRWPELAAILRDCGDTVSAAYDSADAAAMRYQARHRRLVVIAASCGMLAVLIGFMQLSLDQVHAPLVESGGMLEASQIVATVVAVVAIVLGVWVAFSKKWLLEREKAERCRFLKFRFLISPQLWGNVASGARQKWLRNEVEHLEALNEEDLKSWARGEGKVLRSVPPRTLGELDEAVLADLIDYYQEKRLSYQQRYFDRQARRRYRWERLAQRASHVFFFLSILATLGYFVYNLLSTYIEAPSSPSGYTLSISLVVLAACLPVVGSGVRTLQSANEFGRNTLRFQATSNELKQLASDLGKKADPRAKLEILRDVERALNAERREWLRLMMEAEWYG
jgi:hypothetical protein